MTSERHAPPASVRWWREDLLADARAVVVGAGALGNEVVKNLALLGWGTVVLIDFDRVESGNLGKSVLFTDKDVGRPKVEVARSAAARLNPGCAVVALDGELRTVAGAGLFARMDVAFGCVDNAAARVALGQLAGLADCLFVDGGLTSWEGAVRLYAPDDTRPCYVCTLTEEDLGDLTLRHSCLAYARRAQYGQGVPTTALGASVVAALMVQQAVKWIHHDPDALPVRLGEEIRLDLAHDQYVRTTLPRREDCWLHPQAAAPAAAPAEWARAATDWAGLLGSWRHAANDPDAVLRLPMEINARTTCPACGGTRPVNRVQASTGGPEDGYGRCADCGGRTVPDLSNVVTGDEPWIGLSPGETGFPPWSWVETGPGGTADAGAAVHLELPGYPAESELAGLDPRRRG
ncbi:ThiF family adenylyltransferase [Streptomyces sp. NPDC013178]|uniref:HesA/MoeB/ThiF family protein n=1 Tax=unclassified Streptomyces TaxID=2593676 RepID=UPI00340257E9